MKRHLPSILFHLLFLAALTDLCMGRTLHTQTMSVIGNTVQLKVPDGIRVDLLAPLVQPRFLTQRPWGRAAGSRVADIYRLKCPYTTPETLVTLTSNSHHFSYRKTEPFEVSGIA